MNIVLAGGTGFVGGALTGALIARGDKPTLLTRDPEAAQARWSEKASIAFWDGKTGGVSALVMTKDQHLWTGGVLRDLNGSVIGRLPGEGSTESHGAAVAANGDVYLGLLSGKVEKFVKQ